MSDLDAETVWLAAAAPILLAAMHEIETFLMHPQTECEAAALHCAREAIEKVEGPQ